MFLCLLSLLLFLLVLLGKILSFLGTTFGPNFALFFSKCEILFSSVSFFCSLFCFFFDDQKEEEKMVKRKNSVLFFDTLPSHEREKEEKIHHTTTKEEALSEALC